MSDTVAFVDPVFLDRFGLVSQLSDQTVSLVSVTVSRDCS